MTNDSQSNPGRQPSSGQHSEPAPSARQLRSFGLATLGLALCFAIPLRDLIRFAATSEFHSYILLIPFISAYLVWLKKGSLPPLVLRPPAKPLRDLLVAGTLVLVAYWLVLRPRLKLTEDDYLAMMMISFLLLLHRRLRACFWGGKGCAQFLFHWVCSFSWCPFPAFAMPPIDAFLQQGSAAAAQGFFTLWETPFLRNGLAFQLPGINLQVAPECSGIQSSMVLLITGLLASYLFLRTPWKRGLLTLLMIPLGLLRNGFRVFTIGELCVHIGPQMIDSPIHHKGGPIFFALSLIPLFILLVVLQKSERPRAKSKLKAGEAPSPASPK